MQRTLMSRTFTTVLMAALALPSLTHAEETVPPAPLTANLGLVSNYVFRGISQSQNEGAVQGGVDYAYENGLYVGFWGSTVDWVNRSDVRYKTHNQLEADLYGGYKLPLGQFTLDIGAVQYYYLGNDQGLNKGSAGGQIRTPDTLEGYVGLSYGVLSLKYNQVLSRSFIGWGGSSDPNKSNEGTEYIDLTATVPLNKKVEVLAHVGRQIVKNYYQASYTDYLLGATYDPGFGVFGLNVTGTDTQENCGKGIGAYCWNGKNVAKQAVFASYLKTF